MWCVGQVLLIASVAMLVCQIMTSSTEVFYYALAVGQFAVPVGVVFCAIGASSLSLFLTLVLI